MEPLTALPYVDSLIKEYLLFRGFTQTLLAFNAEMAQDKGCGFQADQVLFVNPWRAFLCSI